MNKLIKLLNFIALIFGLGQAHAAIITIDSDNYVVGTNLTNYFPGLTISSLAQRGSDGYSYYNPTVSDVFTETCGGRCAIEEGVTSLGNPSNLFHFVDCENGGSCMSSFRVIEILFDTPTNFIQTNFSWSVDAPGIRAYDAFDNLLTSCGSAFSPPTSGPCDYLFYPYEIGSENRLVLSLNREESDISRLVVGGIAGQSYLNQFSYSVPEPSLLTIMLAGLFGLGIARHRRNIV